MSSRQLRIILRYAHVVGGVLIALHLYIPIVQQNELYTGFVQFIVLPFIVISGLILWQLPRVNKWRNQLRRAA